MDPVTYRDPARRTWPDHDGTPAPDAVYAVPPDPAIGEVRTAWTNRTTAGWRPLPPRMIALLALGAIALVLSLAAVLTALTQSLVPASLPTWAPFAGFVIALSAPLPLLVRRRPATTYVGEEGIQSHVIRALSNDIALLRFADARSLTRSEVREHGDLEVTLVWRDHEGRELHTLHDRRRDRGPFAHETPAGTYARAAERRWSEIRWARAEEEMRTSSAVAFRAGPGTRLVVAEGELRIERSGKRAIVYAAGDVEPITIDDGVLSIRRRGEPRGFFDRTSELFPLSEVHDYPTLFRALRTFGRFAVSG